MSDPRKILKHARKVGTDRTDQGQTFKKPFQMVGRPPTVDHDMHDDFFRTPPMNGGEGEVMPRSSLKWPTKEKNNTLNMEGLGRIKQSDVQSELVEENSVHS